MKKRLEINLSHGYVMKCCAFPHIFRLVCLLLLAVSSPHSSSAQVRPMNIVTNAQGQTYVEREIIVRFAPSALRRSAIDNLNTQSGILSRFLTPKAIQTVSTVLGNSANGVDVFKIYPGLTSGDTLRITPLGDTLRFDGLWTTLVLQLPPGTPEQTTADDLARQLFPLVRYANLNWVGFALAAPSSQTVESTFVVYPNPTEGDPLLTFDDNPANGALTLDLRTNVGTIVRRLDLSAATRNGLRKINLPVSGLPPGLYTYHLTGAKMAKTGKIIKQ